MKDRVFVDGVETTDPELIGFAVLDLAEAMDVTQSVALGTYGEVGTDLRIQTTSHEDELDEIPEMDLVTTTSFIENLEVDFKQCSERCKRPDCGKCGDDDSE